MSSVDFSRFMASVAGKIWGEHNSKLSTKDVIRWGNHGARVVDVAKGTWYDHSMEAGGGCIDLIVEEHGTSKSEAVEWLRENGYEIPESTGGAPKPKKKRDLGEIVATFDYVDEYGNLIYQVCRFEDGTVNKDTGKKNKTFLQRRPDDSKHDGWNWSVKGVRPVLYNLPAVLAAIEAGVDVFIVEGEKAVKAATKLGLVATTNAAGAGKWMSEYVNQLIGARVVILPDNDDAGRNHADVVGSNLRGNVASLQVLELPDLPPKGDVDDWEAAGGTAEAFMQLLATTAYDWRPRMPKSSFGAVDYADIFKSNARREEWLVHNTIGLKATVVLAGPSMSGKSFLVADMALKIAAGDDVNGKRVKQGAVVYQAGEGARGFEKRIEAYKVENGRDTLPFVMLPQQLNLHDDDDQVDAFIAEILAWEAYFGEKVELVVIDTLAAATPGANENDSSHISRVLARVERIRSTVDATVLLVHHMNKDKSQVRGHSMLVANVDNVVLCETLELTDANNRTIRKAVLNKNKDGDAGSQWRYVLRAVEVGRDDHDDPITSCVVDSPSRREGEDQKVLERLNREELVLRKAYYAAIDDKAVLADGKYNLPNGVKQAVKYRDWQREVENLWSVPHDASRTPDEQREFTIKTVSRAMVRLGTRLLSAGHLGRSNEHGLVWWIEKKERQPRAETAQRPRAEIQEDNDDTLPF